MKFKDVVIIIMLSISIVSSCKKEKGAELDPRFSTPEKTYQLWIESGSKGDLALSNLCITKESKKFIDAGIKNGRISPKQFMLIFNSFKEYKIQEVKFQGNMAILILLGPKGQTPPPAKLKKEEDGWKVDMLATFSM